MAAPLPAHLQMLFRLCIDSSHYYHQNWYWWGEARCRTTGGKLELTTIPESERQRVEEEAMTFWEEIAEQSDRNARVVEVLQNFLQTIQRAGALYRYP